MKSVSCVHHLLSSQMLEMTFTALQLGLITGFLRLTEPILVTMCLTVELETFSVGKIKSYTLEYLRKPSVKFREIVFRKFRQSFSQWINVYFTCCVNLTNFTWQFVLLVDGWMAQRAAHVQWIHSNPQVEMRLVHRVEWTEQHPMINKPSILVVWAYEYISTIVWIYCYYSE